MESLVDDALSEADFEIFTRDSIEGNAIYNWAHIWVGSDMEMFQSPRDPVFWLHHNFVDKIFDDWVNIYGTLPSNTVEFEYALWDSRDDGRLLIVDVNGKIWKQLDLERGGNMGKNMVSFSRQGWKAGVYYYTIRVGSRKQSGRLMLL